MKYFLPLLFTFFLFSGIAQPVNQYFEQIRNNEAALTAFFSQMPKGGDLHHHFSGSVYAEPLLETAIAENFYVNTETMKVVKEKPANGKWEQFSTLKERGELDEYKQKIMMKWSVKDYNYVDYPSENLFFESFEKFGQVVNASFEKGLVELKGRAIKENLGYIETQLNSISCNINLDELARFNTQLRLAATMHNEKAVFLMLDTIFSHLVNADIAGYANSFNTQFVEKMHHALGIDDSRFTMRYLNYVLRFMEPVSLFKQLLVAFISADNSPLIVGVNIVAPEHGEVALKDYWLHMEMFRYMHSRYPHVKYSMHAGELALGLVQPEELTWHIRAAVYIAQANRIGHGVDIANEDSCYALLRYMAKNKVPVEINLFSNEFILKVKEGRHPITLYKAFGVPLVISTDDAGVLRTNMTEQYVLLAKRYREFSYTDIKQLVYNSIRYSFIKEPAIKNQLLKDLDNRFKAFESKFPIR